MRGAVEQRGGHLWVAKDDRLFTEGEIVVATIDGCS
jgi:hypothetical protein